jgi:hypothetical protein
MSFDDDHDFYAVVLTWAPKPGGQMDANCVDGDTWHFRPVTPDMTMPESWATKGAEDRALYLSDRPTDDGATP